MPSLLEELQGKQEEVDLIARLARKGTVSLLFGSKDERFNKTPSR
jgi:hypothetical protein